MLLLFALLVIIPQEANAQKQKKFDEAIAKGWIKAKGYAYEDRIEGESKKEKFKEKAREMGYIVNSFDANQAYFYRASEKEKLDLEIEYEKRGKEYELFKTGKAISGSTFKNVGTAFIFSIKNNGDGRGTDYRLLQKISDVKWTGELKNGRLEGNGDGFCNSCAFSGTFHNGFIDKVTIWRSDGEKFDVEILPFSEGMSFMKDNYSSKKRWKYSLVDANGNVISNTENIIGGFDNITDVKQNYTNGKAIVTIKDMDVIINTKAELIGVPDYVTTIKGIYYGTPFSHAVRNSYLVCTKSLTLPASIRVIENAAFSHNTDLESIFLPEGLKEIGSMAFGGCSSLNSIIIPSTVTSIDKEAFYGCKNLTSATIPASLIEYIKGNKIFYKCDKLKEVNVVDNNGNITKDSNWYWKEEKDPEVERQLAEEKRKQAEIRAKRGKEEKAKQETTLDKDIKITVNGVSFWMIYVEGGKRKLGFTNEQRGHVSHFSVRDAESPAHDVTLSSYYIGETEVIQALWEAVMGSNPSDKKGSKRPVTMVSWDDCQEFIQKLNTITGREFRLPTEAEWEYAARGGQKSVFIYSGSDEVGDVAWCSWNWFDKDKPYLTYHDVKTKKANRLGIYDMSGNVEEWCQDWYGNYSSSEQTNPTGPSSGSERVIRGGSYSSPIEDLRVSSRDLARPSWRDNELGLRLAMPFK